MRHPLKIAVLIGALVLAVVVLTTASMPSLQRPTFGQPAPTPDTSMVTLAHDGVLIQCQSPDDCRLPNLRAIPAGSLVKVLNTQTSYVRIVDAQVCTGPHATCVNLRGIEGVMSLN